MCVVIALVERAREALLRARHAARAEGGSLSEEFVLADLQAARNALEEISGRRAPEDLLEHIFRAFVSGNSIGKCNEHQIFPRTLVSAVIRREKTRPT